MTTRKRAPRGAVFLALALAAALLIAACGSSASNTASTTTSASKSSTTGTGTGTTTSRPSSTALTAFRACRKKQGVTLPSGGFGGGGREGLHGAGLWVGGHGDYFEGGAQAESRGCGFIIQDLAQDGDGLFGQGGIGRRVDASQRAQFAWEAMNKMGKRLSGVLPGGDQAETKNRMPGKVL